MKELPYFKFYCNEWITGEISFLDFETQGLFINLCSFYWSKGGNLILTNAKRKFSEVKPTAFNLLIEANIIKVIDEKIVINFLDEQMEERSKLSSTNSANGAKGGRPKKQTESEEKPTALFSESETKAKKSNIEEKREEENKKDIKPETTVSVKSSKELDFEIWWNKYDKKEGRKNSFNKWMKLKDSEIELCLASVDAYVVSTPNKQFRKNPLTYLNGCHWNDEIIINNQFDKIQNNEQLRAFTTEARLRFPNI